ncbi:microfibril-associated glycoprotein 4-like [Channa argus]|uniref:microfibril-associated glycoprotein 4-like n=1 Tax=Channa argus TaxID=215402 RepID=UPI00352100A6
MKMLIPVVLLLLAPVLISSSTIRPVDCSEIHQQNKTQSSGVYVIYRAGDGIPLQVYCDMDSLGGGWTVFQRRMDGSLNFYRPWDQYKKGFGNTFGEYWLGLDNVYFMTNKRKYELLVDMEDFDEKKVYARFSTFSISDECDGYKLKVSGFIDGGAGDSLSLHNGQKFSTFDKDQDASGSNMAVLHVGAFWYYNSLYANPNGVYRWGPDSSHYYIGVEWYTWKGTTYSLKAISMKIRPVK